MTASGYCVAMMVNHVGIYGFCLFKQKRWVRADVSINTNMYGLKHNGLREKKFRKKKATKPLHLLLPVLRCVLREVLCGRRRRVSSLQFFFFHVAGEGCVGVHAQLLYSVNNK
jgi:hypothetical protein